MKILKHTLLRMSIYILCQLQKSQKHFGMPSTLSKPSFISFNELIPGSDGVRYTDINGFTYMSIRDIIMVVCSKKKKDACDTWADLPETYKNELSEFLREFQFKGRGEMLRPVITLQGALKLIMWLPGNMAKDFRSQACDILTRYLAGDQTMHDELNFNATSTAPLNEFARASLPEPSRDAMIQQFGKDLSHLAPLVPIVKQLTDEMGVLRADRDRERHMRHQADGRYGSEVREANKNVRDQAEFWKKMADTTTAGIHNLLDRNSEKDQIILECYRKFFKDADASPQGAGI